MGFSWVSVTFSGLERTEMCRDAHNAQQGCFHCPSSRTNPVASFSHRKLEPRATAQPLAAGMEPEIQLLGAGAFACLQGKFMCSHGTSLWAPCLLALLLWDIAPAVGWEQFFFSWQQLSQVALESMDWEICQQCPWP